MESFSSNCREISRIGGLGAWVEEALASFVVSFQVEDCVNLLMFRSAKDYLRFYPNNALIYSVVSEMLSRNGVALVSFGLESLKSIEGVDTFKTSMGFQKRPLYQKVVLNPLIGWGFNGLTKRCIHALARYRPDSIFLRNAAGVIDLL